MNSLIIEDFPMFKSKLLSDVDAQNANKLIDYKNFDIHKHLEDLLNEETPKQRTMGIIPRYGNLVNEFIKDTPSITSEVFTINCSDKMKDYLNRSQFMSFLQELESYLKIMNSVIVVVQYNQNEDNFNFDIIHRGNMMYVEDESGITELAYKVGEWNDRIEDKIYSMQRVQTKDVVYEVLEEDRAVQVVNEYQNNYNQIPIQMFYYTSIPYRNKFTKPHTDLLSIADTYNLHLTYISFTSKQNKFATLFTNGKLPEDYIVSPNSVVEIEQYDKDVYLEFKSPGVDLKTEYELLNGFVDRFYERSFITTSTSNIRSGIQLYLYDKRMKKSMNNIIEVFKKCTINLLNEIVRQISIFKGQTETIDNVDIKIHDFIDPESYEKVQTERIENGRASIVDYLMESHNLTEVEATKKYNEIINMKRGIDDTSKPK